MPTHSPARSIPTGPPSRPRGRSFLAAIAASALALGALLGAGTAATAAPLPAGTTFDDGVVYVGANDLVGNGGIGNGSTTGSDVPASADYAGTALDGVTVDKFLTNTLAQLVLTDDGKLISWGWNGSGQLGDGTTTDRATAEVIDVAGTPLEGKTVTDIALGYSTSYALTSDGTVAAWGNNAWGQIGDGTTDDRLRRPQQTSLLSAANRSRACLHP